MAATLPPASSSPPLSRWQGLRGGDAAADPHKLVVAEMTDDAPPASHLCDASTSDGLLQVGGSVFPVNKSLLARTSPFFAAVFGCCGSDHHGDSQRPVLQLAVTEPLALPGLLQPSPEAFTRLLHHVSTGDTGQSVLCASTLAQLATQAHYLQVEPLYEASVQALAARWREVRAVAPDAFAACLRGNGGTALLHDVVRALPRAEDKLELIAALGVNWRDEGVSYAFASLIRREASRPDFTDSLAYGTLEQWLLGSRGPEVQAAAEHIPLAVGRRLMERAVLSRPLYACARCKLRVFDAEQWEGAACVQTKQHMCAWAYSAAVGAHCWGCCGRLAYQSEKCTAAAVPHDFRELC